MQSQVKDDNTIMELNPMELNQKMWCNGFLWFQCE